MRNKFFMQEEVVILSGSRTAIGSFGGSLKSVSPIELGTVVAKKALEISEVDKVKLVKLLLVMLLIQNLKICIFLEL